MMSHLKIYAPISPKNVNTGATAPNSGNFLWPTNPSAAAAATSANSAASNLVGMQIPCHCSSFLDPFHLRNGASTLPHYCRICNTKLNSCKQARIHAEGKKHDKRFSYIKLNMENNGGATSLNNNAQTTMNPSQPHQQPQQPVHHHQQQQKQQQLAQQQPTAARNYHPLKPQNQGGGGVANSKAKAELSDKKAPPTYDSSTNGMKPLADCGANEVAGSGNDNNAPIMQMFPSYLHYTAPPAAFYFPAQSYPYDFATVAIPPPGTPPGIPVPLCPIQYPFYPTAAAAATPTKALSDPDLQRSSTRPKKGGTGGGVASKKGGGGAKSVVGGACSTSSSSKSGVASSTGRFSCDLCSMTFPSLAVLNNHVKGSRHMRKVKSAQAYRQMKAAGTAFKQEAGEIQCEVCRVSVNSSHQLQAHLAGHRHKVRCFRRGLDPCAAMITPTSTPPSTAPSECSTDPRSSAASSKYHYVGIPLSKHTTSKSSSLLGQYPNVPAAAPSSFAKKSYSKASQKPGLLGEYPGSPTSLLKGLLPLPLTPPMKHVNNNIHSSNGNNNSNNSLCNSTANSSAGQSKVKTRKSVRPTRPNKERRDSTTESDEAAEHQPPPKNNENKTEPPAIKKDDNANMIKEIEAVEAEAEHEEDTSNISSSLEKSSNKGHDFSSDEAKESEGESEASRPEMGKILEEELCTSGDKSEVAVEAVEASKTEVKGCDICNITVNSATQLSQHMNSPKHHVKVAEEQQQINQSRSGDKGKRWDHQSDDSKLKDIPMLKKFLKTLQTPSKYYPIEREEAEGESSNSTEVER